MLLEDYPNQSEIRQLDSAFCHQKGVFMTSRRNFKWKIVFALASICAASWLAMCAGLVVRFSLPIWTGIVTSAALSTEILFWGVAGALGVTVIKARHRLWDWLVRQLRRRR
jgi:hypothetical protein